MQIAPQTVMRLLVKFPDETGGMSVPFEQQDVADTAVKMGLLRMADSATSDPNDYFELTNKGRAALGYPAKNSSRISLNGYTLKYSV
jgi:hypothetical protein